MKVRLFAVAATALLSIACLTSCSNDEVLPVEEQNTVSSCPKVIHVNFDQSSATRLVMGEDGLTPQWEEFDAQRWSGDMLRVSTYNEDGHRITTQYFCTDASKGEFTIGDNGWYDMETGEKSSSDPAGPYVITYGSTASANGIDMQNKTIDFIGYSFMTSSNHINYSLMAAVTNDLNDVTMKNVGALLKISIPSAFTEAELVLKATGIGTYNYETGEWILGSVPELGAFSSLGNCNYDPANGQTEEDVIVREPGVFYIPVIPQTIESINISYTDAKLPVGSNDTPVFVNFEKVGKANVVANTVYDLGELPRIPTMN